MSIISRKFNAKISALKSEFQVNKDIEHQGVKGGLNENELASLIRSVIPQRFQVTKGIIENSKGEQSNETDILIYDDEILPLYIKDDLTFVPVEAVKYNFEVKSRLDSQEIKTTIQKFQNFRKIGGLAPTVLFGFSTDIKGSELSRLKKYDPNFFTNPAIGVFCSSNKCYYFKTTEVQYLKDHTSISDVMKSANSNMNEACEALNSLLLDDRALSSISRSQFATLLQRAIDMNAQLRNIDDKKLVINGLNFDEITFKVHRWFGVEVESNEVELGLLSGISNTLSKAKFGEYLLSEAKHQSKTYAVCYEDMWGNTSCQDYDESGLSYESGNVSFSFKTTQESSQIVFSLRS